MQYIYHPKTTISDLQIYGSSAPRIPEDFEKTGEFRPPQKGEMFLSTCLTCEVAEENWPDSSPRIILRKKKVLTEVEREYGEGATVESLWKRCPEPEKYGTPRFGIPPIGSFIAYRDIGMRFGECCIEFDRPRVYAFKLNEWQKTYFDESITDAKALEVKLRALGELEGDEEIEPEMRHAEPGECFVGVGMWRSGIARHRHEKKRAIVRKKAQPKKKFLKIPLESNGMFFNDQGLWQWPCMFPTGTIIEE